MRELRENSGFSRRTVLVAAAGAAPLLATMTSGVDAAVKVPQSAVHYQAAPRDGQDCGHCAHFLAPGACKLVDGDISPAGWCRLWVKKVG